MQFSGFALRLLMLGLALCGLAGSARALQSAALPIGVLFATPAQSASQCPAMAQEKQAVQILEEIFTDTRHEARSAQLFAPVRYIARPLALAASQCLAGQADSCRVFEQSITRLVQSDAMRLDARRMHGEPSLLATAKLAGNLSLRPLALHVALLRERHLVSGSPALDAWLQRRALEYRHVPRKLDARAAQNLVLHSVLTTLTVAIATGTRQPALDEAAAIYHLYLDTMRPDGSLPQETRRGASALKYDSMAVGNLLLLGLLAHTQGLPLLEYRGPHGDLHQAVRFVAAALDDDRAIAGYAAENVTPTDKGPASQQARAFLRADASWIVLYARSFPRQTAGNALMRHFMTSRPAWTPAFPYDETLGLAGACLLRTGGVS